MNNLKKLLKILADGKLHSGADVGKKLGVTRAAIWKLMERLRALEIPIDAKTNQGYCIPGGLELLDVKKIQSKLNPPFLPMKLFDELSSTNTYLLERARAGEKDIRVCLAEYQPAGRGRFGRKWVSPFGQNIALSLLWTFHCDLSRLSGLSLVVAIAIARALKQCGIKKDVSVKWPNDVLWQGKKISGTLIELHGESHHHADAIIGIGLNMALSEAAKAQITKSAVGLNETSEVKVSRNDLVAFLLNHLVEVLEVFQGQGLAPFLKEWQALDAAMDRPIHLLLGNKKISGIYRGIDPARGDLLVEDEKGVVHHYSSGEVSIQRA